MSTAPNPYTGTASHGFGDAPAESPSTPPVAANHDLLAEKVKSTVTDGTDTTAIPHAADNTQSVPVHGYAQAPGASAHDNAQQPTQYVYIQHPSEQVQTTQFQFGGQSEWVYYACSFFFPWLGVLLKYGCDERVLLAWLLTLFFWIPGVVYAFLIISNLANDPFIKKQPTRYTVVSTTQAHDPAQAV